METPIHIISQNKKMIENFKEYGFSAGLLADIERQPMKHQGFLSMFVREMAKNYGEKGGDIPPYLAEGIAAF